MSESRVSSAPFDLRALVREVAAESEAADPAIVAKEVERRLDRAALGEALAQALPIVVYHVAGRPATSPTPSPGQQQCDTHTGAAGGGPTSSKVAAIRETWRRHLRDRVSVGPSEWKFLADCTADDLAYAAALRDDLAAANAARANWLRELAERVTNAGVERVEQLDDDQLAQHLGAAT